MPDEEVKKVRVSLKQKDCYCDLITLYDNILRATGKEPAPDDIYEPSRVWCSKGVQYEVFQFYKDKGHNDVGIAMHWCNSGPKAIDELPDYEFDLEPNWVHKKGEEK